MKTTDQTEWKLFQSLIGNLQTRLTTNTESQEDLFQSLIGNLQTFWGV